MIPEHVALQRCRQHLLGKPGAKKAMAYDRRQYDGHQWEEAGGGNNQFQWPEVNKCQRIIQLDQHAA